MALISLTNVQLAYGHHALLDHADFSLETGERVGLIGRNGTGKSSLLNVLAGRTLPDDGQLVRMGGLTVELVQQEPELDDTHTVYEAVLNQSAADEAHDQEHDMDAWRRPAMVRGLVDRLQLPADTPVSGLSGRMRKRVAL
nr:ABC-F family ATP-binding cassette domain-containing protein [Pseudomonas sp.]